ncbi:MAG TPA: NUDIX domain-containing protein [Tepidisphaeraceae bacterium]|jgi:8-oxo-dGTP pyrophosphatase MutT (NUDIX family)
MRGESGGPILRFHATGDWQGERVRVRRVASTWQGPPQVLERIEAAWREATARPGVHLFDGPMCRLESWEATPQHLSVALSETSYKKFLGTNLTNPGLADRYGPSVLASPVGVSPALLTADGYLMMGRRNASVAYYPHRIHPFAGALDPADADPFEAIRRELNEELGFAPEDVTDMRCTGVAEDVSIRQPELIFFARANRTRAEVEAALDRTEHHDTWSVVAQAQEVAQAIEEAAAAAAGEGEFTPVGLASLLLYGRIAFGEGWFARVGAVVTGGV